MTTSLKDTYNLIARDWHNDHHLVEMWPREDAEIFAGLLEPDATVLDVGCGSGLKAKIFNQLGLKVDGFDISEKMIEIAKKEAPESHFQVMDIYNIDKIDKKYDGVFAQAVLLHFPKRDFDNLVQKLLDKAKAGGFLYLSVKTWEDGRLPEEVKTENDYGYEYQRFFSYYKIDEVKKPLRELKIVSENPGDTPTGKWIRIIAQKV